MFDPALPSRIVRDDLQQLARIADLASLHAQRVLERKRMIGDADSHRDALHLLARIEGLSRQIEHAADALRRIEHRENIDNTPVSSPTLPYPSAAVSPR